MKISVLIFWEVFSKTIVVGFCFDKIVKRRPVNFIKIVIHHRCYSGNFPKFAEVLLLPVNSCFGNFLHFPRKVHILLTNFHLNHSKSRDCPQVYVIKLAMGCFWIYCNTLLLLLGLRCSPEIMLTDNLTFDIMSTGTTPSSQSDYSLQRMCSVKHLKWSFLRKQLSAESR